MDTLDELSLHSRKHLGYRCMIPMDTPFFEYLHSRRPQQTQDTVSKDDTQHAPPPALDFSDLASHWTRVVSLSRPSAAQTCRAPIEIARSVVVDGNQPGFMGPLCCPLTKCNAAWIAKESDQYWVTEKSDGIRVIFVSLLAPLFPRWRRVVGPGTLEDVALADCVSLEAALHELNHHPTWTESSQFRLTFGSHCLRRHPKGPNVFVAVLRTADSGSANQLEQGSFMVRSLGPRHFSYVFDRSVDVVYLLQDEYPITALSCVVLDAELCITAPEYTTQTAEQQQLQQQQALPTTAKRMFLAVFDCFAYMDVDLADAASSHAAWPQRFAASRLTLLQRTPLSERYQRMRELLFTPMRHAMTVPGASFRALQSPLVLKRLVLVRDMKEFMPLLRRHCVVAAKPTSSESHDKTEHQRVAEECDFTFHGYEDTVGGATKNDGFIFTPEHFDIISGSQPKQLKWKWPEKLTVDWMVAPCPRQLGCYDVKLYFKKKRMEKDRSDDAGHTQYSRSLNIENPLNLALPPLLQGQEGSVVECKYVPCQATWVMVKLRTEKKEANSVTTVLSVVESVAENIDIACLLELVAGNTEMGVDGEGLHDLVEGDDEHNIASRPMALDDVALSSVQHLLQRRTDDDVERQTTPLTKELAPPLVVRPCKMVLRATMLRFCNEVSVVMQWSVKLPSVRNVLVCNHRKVQECFGMGEPCEELDPTSHLRDLLLLDIANAGGCYAWSNVLCDAFYDGQSGRWGIVALHPNKSSNDAFFTQVLDHITAVSTFRSQYNRFPPLPAPLNQPGERRRVGDTAAPWELALEVKTNQHYAERAKHLSHGMQTPRSALRRMNNFVKSVLIHSAVGLASATLPPVAAASSSIPKLTVMDLCCGRGGDLTKWKHQGIGFLLMVDSSFGALAEAASRYCTGQGLSTKVVAGKEGYPGIPARFHVRDCFEVQGMMSLLNQVKAEMTSSSLSLRGDFDIVSCQFSMHYGFVDEQHVRAFLTVVSAALRAEGIFIGTTVSDKELLARRERYGPSFGNDIYHVDFPSTPEAAAPPSPQRVYGEEYAFSIEHSVEAQTEYVVQWRPFVQLATEYGLDLIETSSFTETHDAFALTEVGQRIISTVVRESGGESAAAAENASSSSGVRRTSSGEMLLVLEDNEREAVDLFRSFLFKKRR